MLRNPKCSAFCLIFYPLEKNSPKPVSVKAKKQTDKAKTAPQFCKKGLVFSPGCTLEQVLAVSESLRRRKPTSYIARPCLAPLSVAFSSFVKTEFCRISLKGTPLAISRIFTKGSSICRFLILRDSKLLRNPKCYAFCFIFYPLEKNSPKPVSVKAKKQTAKAKTASQFCKKV